MIPFDLAEPTSLAAAIKLLEPGRPDDPPDRRRHRADADDEGRRVQSGKAHQPAQDREQVFEHQRRRRRASHRRDDDAWHAGALRRRAKACPCHHPHPADAVERARAQCRDRRRRAGPRRSAHGPAAGADGARRDADGHRPEGRAQARGRGPVRRLLRNRAGEERIDRRGPCSVAGHRRRPPTSKSPPARPTTGRRSASPPSSKPTAMRSSRRASSPAPRPTRRRG